MIFEKTVTFSIRERATPCRIVFKEGDFNHRFGGISDDKGAIPKGSKKRMLKVLELDLTDPLCPVQCDDAGIKRLPLYYPLCFDFGGGEVQYTLNKKGKLKLFNHPEEDDEDESEEYPHPEELPEYSVSLEPLSYEEYRALAVAEVNMAYDMPESDKNILKQIDSDRLMRIGGEFKPQYGTIQWQCKNKSCDWSELEAAAGIFLCIPSEPIEGLDIWGQDSWGPEIYFCICRSCNTIFTVNRCT